MNPMQHAKILAFLACVAFVAVLAPGVIIWILRAIMALMIAGCIVALYFWIALIVSMLGGRHG